MTDTRSKKETSTVPPKINPECRGGNNVFASCKPASESAKQLGLCTFRGLTADEELQEICSACKKMYFSSTKPYSGPFYSYSFFLIFVSGLFNILFFYCIILSLISSLIKSVLCFMKTWCNLLLLHFLINRIPFYFIISDPSQYSFDRRI